MLVSYMLWNIIAFVPNILLQERFTGAVSSVLLAIPLGLLMMFVFMKSIGKFPGMGLPEILSAHAPGWIRAGLILILMVMWYLGGLIILLAFTTVTKSFINPETPVFYILSIYLLLALLISPMKSLKVLYFTEILIVINIPVLLMIIFLAYTDELMDWNAITEIGTYVLQAPNLTSISAASYLFSGYATLIIFNRVLQNYKFRAKSLWVIGFIGTFSLITTFCIPVGFHGADGSGSFVFAWISTADSLRMEYAPMERVTLPFLIVYLSLALIGVIVHWHISCELFRSLMPPKRAGSKIPTWIFLLCCGGIAYFLEYSLVNVHDVFYFGQLWLQVRMLLEIVLVSVVFLAARRKKYE